MTLLASLLTGILFAAAVFHAYWGNGGLWPAVSEAELARTVVGDGRSRMPPPWACFTVAVLLGALAVLPWLILAYPNEPLAVTVGVLVAAVFFVRGSAGYSPRWRSRFSAQPFAKRDQQLYSPLCLAVATGFMALLAREL